VIGHREAVDRNAPHLERPKGQRTLSSQESLEIRRDGERTHVTGLVTERPPQPQDVTTARPLVRRSVGLGPHGPCRARLSPKSLLGVTRRSGSRCSSCRTIAGTPLIAEPTGYRLPSERLTPAPGAFIRRIRNPPIGSVPVNRPLPVRLLLQPPCLLGQRCPPDEREPRFCSLRSRHPSFRSPAAVSTSSVSLPSAL